MCGSEPLSQIPYRWHWFIIIILLITDAPFKLIQNLDVHIVVDWAEVGKRLPVGIPLEVIMVPILKGFERLHHSVHRWRESVVSYPLHHVSAVHDASVFYRWHVLELTSVFIDHLEAAGIILEKKGESAVICMGSSPYSKI